MFAGRRESQYFVGSFSPSGPLDQKPFFRPRFAALEVAPCNANAQTSVTRFERRVRPLAPGDGLPIPEGQAEGRSLNITGRCASSRRKHLVGLPRPRIWGLGGKGPVPWCATICRRHKAGRVRRAPFANRHRPQRPDPSIAPCNIPQADPPDQRAQSHSQDHRHTP